MAAYLSNLQDATHILNLKAQSSNRKLKAQRLQPKAYFKRYAQSLKLNTSNSKVETLVIPNQTSSHHLPLRSWATSWAPLACALLCLVQCDHACDQRPSDNDDGDGDGDDDDGEEDDDDYYAAS